MPAPPDNRSRPAVGAAPETTARTSDGIVRQAADVDVAHFRRRVLVGALAEATADYWLRRAAQFAAVGTPECDQVALACRRHADLMADHILDIAELLEEVA